MEELKTTEEANKEVLEKAREDEDKLIEAKNDLMEANMKIQELEKKAFGHADQTLVEELKALREENQDRVRGMENLHGIIESSQKLLDEKKMEITNLETQVEDLKIKVNQSEDVMKSLEENKMEVAKLETQVEEFKLKVNQSEDAMKSLEDLSSQVQEKVHIISSLNEELHVAKLRAETLEKQQNDRNDMFVNQIDSKVSKII